MRVVCPNCGAEYELDSALVPPGGRDLQCSECDHAWFERRPGAPAQPPKPAAATPPTEARPVRRPRDEAPPPSAPAAPAEVDEDDDAAPPHETSRPEPAPRPLDNDVRRILSEEASRERDRRRGGNAMRDDTPPRRPDARSDPPRRDEAPYEPAARTPPRRDTPAPNARTIKSTGLSREADAPEKPVQPQTRRSGLATGFLTVLVIVAVLVLLYIGADLVADRMPAVEPELESYTAAIDTLLARAGALIQNVLGEGT